MVARGIRAEPRTRRRPREVVAIGASGYHTAMPLYRRGDCGFATLAS
jgi:hypothetical protein